MSPSGEAPSYSSSRLAFGRRSLSPPREFLSSSELKDTACLVLDIQMPGMNGLELQSRLASLGFTVPIVFITAYDDEESRGRAMRAGAAAFLSKPFSDEQLLQTVRSALEGEPMLPKLILVVDDDESIRRTTRLLLSPVGFERRSSNLPKTF